MPRLLGSLFTHRPRRWKDSRPIPLTEHPCYAHYHYGEMDECGQTATDEQLQDLIADTQMDGYRDPER